VPVRGERLQLVRPLAGEGRGVHGIRLSGVLSLTRTTLGRTAAGS
jgi:hypothetical protein